jgi:hypothetical protein
MPKMKLRMSIYLVGRKIWRKMFVVIKENLKPAELSNGESVKQVTLRIVERRNLIETGKVKMQRRRKKYPTITIGGPSKGNSDEVRIFLKNILDLEYPKEKITYLFVCADEESKKPFIEMLPKERTVLLLEKPTSEKYRGAHFLGGAWKQLQKETKTEYFLFCDTDLCFLPRTLLLELLGEERVDWDIIGPYNRMEGRDAFFDSGVAYREDGSRFGGHPPEKLSVFPIRMRSFCVCWLSKTSVWKQYEIMDPDCYIVGFWKLWEKGIKMYMCPWITVVHISGGNVEQPIAYLVQKGMLSIHKLLEEKITTEEHLNYLFKITTGKGLYAWYKPRTEKQK